MDKVVKFINTGCFREALARLCRLAQQPLKDGRIMLDDWEIIDESPRTEQCPCKPLENNSAKLEITANIESKPLFWLQTLDEYLYHNRGADTFMPEDTIDDGFGGSKVLPLYPGFGGGARKRQKGNLSYWLKHFRVIPLDNPHGIPIDVTEIPQGYKEWIDNCFHRQKIKIGIVHFSDNSVLDIEYLSNDWFICRGLSDENERLNKALKYIREAKSKGVHLLILPELTITKSLRNAIISEIERLYDTSEDHELAVPIILPGSFHEQFQGKWRNHAEALIGLDGLKILECDKRKKAGYLQFTERIEHAPVPATFLFSSLGLIGITICKDFFEPQPASILHSLSLDWLLVPSMSNQLGPHNAPAYNLYNTCGTVSAVANQEMPDSEQLIPGFVRHSPGQEPTPCSTGLTVIEVQRCDLPS